MEYNMEWAQNINDSVEQLESDVSSTQKATRQNRLVITGIGVVCGVTALMLRAAMAGITNLSNNLALYNGHIMSIQQDMFAVKKFIQTYVPDEQAPEKQAPEKDDGGAITISPNARVTFPVNTGSVREDLTVENVNSQA